MSISKTETRERVFIQIAIDKIEEINEQLNAYDKYMSDEDFDNSKEVNKMYEKLRD